MKKFLVIIIPISLILLVLILILFNNSDKLKSSTDESDSSTNQTLTNSTSKMKITSSAFENNAAIPAKYTCDGDDINPPLIFHDIPDKAKSLVLIVADPDAPVGTWDHWIIFNIPPDTTEISENDPIEDASLGQNSFGKLEYGGPCPPSGTHRYFFKLYALDTTIDLAPGADKSAIDQEMNGHVIDSCEIIGLYSRN